MQPCACGDCTMPYTITNIMYPADRQLIGRNAIAIHTNLISHGQEKERIVPEAFMQETLNSVDLLLSMTSEENQHQKQIVSHYELSGKLRV